MLDVGVKGEGSEFGVPAIRDFPDVEIPYFMAERARRGSQRPRLENWRDAATHPQPRLHHLQSLPRICRPRRGAHGRHLADRSVRRSGLIVIQRDALLARREHALSRGPFSHGVVGPQPAGGQLRA